MSSSSVGVGIQGTSFSSSYGMTKTGSSSSITAIDSFVAMRRRAFPVATRVTAFKNERRSEADGFFARVHIVSSWLLVSGCVTILVVRLLGLIDILSERANSVILPIGYFFMTLGIVIFSACDPEDTNFDVVVKQRPFLRIGLSLTICLSMASYISRGFLLCIIAFGCGLYVLVRGRAMAPLAFVMSVVLFAPVSTRDAMKEIMAGEVSMHILHGLPGFFLIQGHWWWNNIVFRVVGDKRPAQETTCFYTETFIFLVFRGVHFLLVGLEAQKEAKAEGKECDVCSGYWATACCMALPPVLIICIGRQRWFGLCARRFNLDPKRYMRDAAFIAQLLDAVVVQVGEEWWKFRDEKDPSFPEMDQRHHFRKGTISTVQKNSFKVDFPATAQDAAEVMVVPLAGRKMPVDELTQLAKQSLRCMTWDRLTLDLMASGPICAAPDPLLAANVFLQTSRPVKDGETIDFFLSHSWHDDPVAKYEALCGVAKEFKKRHGRDPTFWLDKTCIDQTRIGDGLRVLPLTVMSCDRLLMLFTPNYSQRLWCVWELFTIMAFFRLEQALERIVPVILEAEGEDDGNANAKYDKLCSFEACEAKCFDPNDENRLRKVITAVGEERFNSRIRHLGYMCKQQHEAQLSLQQPVQLIGGTIRILSPSFVTKPTMAIANAMCEFGQTLGHEVRERLGNDDQESNILSSVVLSASSDVRFHREASVNSAGPHSLTPHVSSRSKSSREGDDLDHVSETEDTNTTHVGAEGVTICQEPGLAAADDEVSNIRLLIEV